MYYIYTYIFKFIYKFNNLKTIYIYTYIYIYIVNPDQTSQELLSGNSEIPVPGGFGAAGAPNDAWHQVMHAITKSYLRLAVGWGEFPTLRRRMEEMELSSLGQPTTK